MQIFNINSTETTVVLKLHIPFHNFFCFVYLFICNSFNTTVVSVEYILFCPLTFRNIVSIQPLFRWNRSKQCRNGNFWCVSIQPLFRWNKPQTRTFEVRKVKFQYNRCFGGIMANRTWENWCFYVSIQPLFRWNTLNSGLFKTYNS